MVVSFFFGGGREGGKGLLCYSTYFLINSYPLDKKRIKEEKGLGPLAVKRWAQSLVQLRIVVLHYSAQGRAAEAL